VGQEKLGMVNESIIKAMGAFGGGIASTGRVCGILTGAVALISSIYSRGNLSETEDPRMWRLSYKFAKRFEELAQDHGGVDCLHIARVDWRDRESTRQFYTGPESRRSFCLKLLGDAAYALGELLEHEVLKEE